MATGPSSSSSSLMEKPLPPSSLQRPQHPLPLPPPPCQQQMERPRIGAVHANQVGLELPIAAIAAPTPREASVLFTVAFVDVLSRRVETVNRKSEAARVPAVAGHAGRLLVVAGSAACTGGLRRRSSARVSAALLSRSCLFVSFLERSMSARALPWRKRRLDHGFLDVDVALAGVEREQRRRGASCPSGRVSGSLPCGGRRSFSLRASSPILPRRR